MLEVLKTIFSIGSILFFLWLLWVFCIDKLIFKLKERKLMKMARTGGIKENLDLIILHWGFNSENRDNWLNKNLKPKKAAEVCLALALMEKSNPDYYIYSKHFSPTVDSKIYWLSKARKFDASLEEKIIPIEQELKIEKNKLLKEIYEHCHSLWLSWGGKCKHLTDAGKCSVSKHYDVSYEFVRDICTNESQESWLMSDGCDFGLAPQTLASSFEIKDAYYAWGKKRF